MTERFKRAYDLLIKAYFNDELKAGDCTACAVGNICGGDGRWFSIVDFRIDGLIKSPYTLPHRFEYYEQLTSYSFNELLRIERAFESNTKIKECYSEQIRATHSEILADQYNGLKAVIELMMSFDNIEGEQYTEKLKEKLVSTQ